jgi:ABC-2 type transport system permease protein
VRLVAVELFRFRSRAFSWFAAGLLLLVAAGFAIESWHDAKPPSAAQVALAQEFYEADVTRFGPDGTMTKQCRETAAEMRADGIESVPDCNFPAPDLDEYLPQPRDFTDAVTSATNGLTVPLVLAALAAAASFVTAEFGTGSMGLWLTFVPRRGTVFASKTVAAMLAAVPLTVAGFLATVGGMAAVYGAYGRPLGDAGLWSDLAATGLRQVPLAVLAAAVGAGLAFAVRHAAAVAGVLVWWVVAVELALGQVLPALQPVALGLNTRAWLHGGASYAVTDCSVVDATMGCQVRDHVVGAAQGGAVLLVVAVVVAAVGLVVFRWRDVSS